MEQNTVTVPVANSPGVGSADDRSSLRNLRRGFEQQARRSLSMPLAGALVWLAVTATSLAFPGNAALYALLFGTGMIFPIALLISKTRGEAIVSNANPLARLLGLSVLMVNLLWAVHIPLLITTPELFPVSLGIALGIHWVIYSWIVQHPVGLVHAVVRTLGVAGVWVLVPETPVWAIGLVVVFAYALSIAMMSTRRIVTELGGHPI